MFNRQSSHQSDGLVRRSRWAAIGAGAATLPIANAITSSGERTSYTAITPCRLADFRPEFQVGPRSSPLGPNETHTIAARGAQGNCSAAQLPADAVALQLNVTALGATAPTFLSITPDGSTGSSSLNPTPNAPPTPNAVTVRLAADGNFKVFNLQGSVAVFFDVVGFYTDHNHDDRYYTKSEIDGRKFLPLNVYSDPGLNFNSPTFADLNDMGAGSQDVDYNLTLPPDYTAGTDLTLRVLAYSRDPLCTARVSRSWTMAVSPGKASTRPTVEPTTIERPVTSADVTELFEFTINGDGLEPLDGLGFGLFWSGGLGRCPMVYAALGLLYD